jgi:hypothetical protein
MDVLARRQRDPGNRTEVVVQMSTRTERTGDMPETLGSVVWRAGHAFVLEVFYGRPQWIGLDGWGRPLALTTDQLARYR